MGVICPVTGKECPYLKKLDTDICPREHECDVVKESYSGMIQKPPARGKFLIILFSIILAVIIGLLLVFFLVLDGDLSSLSSRDKNPDPTPPAPTADSASTTEPTATPNHTTQLPSQTTLPVTTPAPASFTPVPVTSEDARKPVYVEINSMIGEIKSVSLDEHGSIDVIPSARIISWYEGSFVPGNPGNCILFGYKHYDGMEGIFFNLARLQPGDKIKITLDNGSIIEQTVTESIIYRDGYLPEEALALENPTPRTVLISETGEIDPATGNFKDLIAIIAE